MINIQYEDLHVDEFKEKMKEPDTVVIDVRDESEMVEGYIDGYKLINMFSPDFIEQLENLDRNKTYLVYCRSGNRSAQTCSLMTRMGFDRVYNLNGGIMAWNFYSTHTR
jgi:rhodanese-related sulfurtransferase